MGLAQPGNIILASTSDAGVKGRGDSFASSLSGDGTKVAFHSDARNLDPTDPDTTKDVYVKDLATGDLTLASTSDAGVKGNGVSFGPTLLADGTKVAFSSSATNLDPADPDSTTDVYVKDLATGDIALASTSDTGTKGNGSSIAPSLSASGTKVAFYSSATNLDPADTDTTLDVYVKDLATGDVMLASTSDAGVKGNKLSFARTLSADGTHVAFYSDATNLDPSDSDGHPDIYVKDLATGDLTLASTSDAGVKGNFRSLWPSLSADGTRVSFYSLSGNLDASDTDSVADIYVKDLATGDITLASTSDAGVKGDNASLASRLSADGTIVAFDSFAMNLDPSDTDSINDIYVKNLATGDLTLASTSDAGVKGNENSQTPFLSADATRVAFSSLAETLDPADTDGLWDSYVKELGGPAPAFSTSGHAHTDYSGDSTPGPGDVHVITTVASGAAEPTGRVGYSELRADPPGPPGRAFNCRGLPTTATQSGPHSVEIEGVVTCTSLSQAVTFSLTLTDGGRNPPNQDAYLMMIFDGSGTALYEWSDLTTVGLGDLVVRSAPSGTHHRRSFPQ